MNASEPIRKCQERRVSPRVKFHTQIHLASHSNFYTGLTGDISEGGVFVATHNIVSIGTIVALEFTLSDGQDAITVRGEVRWAAEYSELSDGHPGVGVKFVDLTEHDRQRIERFVRSRDTMFYE